MKIKIIDNLDYQTFPLTDDMVDIDISILNSIGVTKQFDGFSGKVIDYDNTEDLKGTEIIRLREKRERECFPIINRGKLWYDNLTDTQLKELEKWYNDWLNVTETLEEPVKPEWIK